MKNNAFLIEIPILIRFLKIISTQNQTIKRYRRNKEINVIIPTLRP